MSDKESDSFEDIQKLIEFTVLQSETKPYPMPPDKDVFFTKAELINIQPDSANKIVTLTVDYEVIYFHSDVSDEDQKEANVNDLEINPNKDNESYRIKTALDHITINIPISSSSPPPSNSDSNQSTQTLTPASATQTESSSFSSQGAVLNSSSNSVSIQIQFCPEMNPVFHVSGPADVKLTGFIVPSNYDLIEEEEESDDENVDNIKLEDNNAEANDAENENSP